jgi:4-hydroxy-tetrahydrodipicolinate synthase
MVHRPGQGPGAGDCRRRLELDHGSDLAGEARREGRCDAVLVVTPYYNKPTQEGMYQHFKAVNDAIGIPIIIYNIPPRSVVDMSVETMKRLCSS